MPPQPIKAICILSLADTLAGLGSVANNGTLIPAPAAAVVKNSRREVTLYFLSDEEAGVEVLLVEVELEELELSEEDPPELLEESDLDASFLSDLSEDPSPSFLPPPLLGPELPLLA